MLTSGISNPAGMGSSTKTLKNNVNSAINVTGITSRKAFRKWAGCAPPVPIPAVSAEPSSVSAVPSIDHLNANIRCRITCCIGCILPRTYTCGFC